MAVNALWHAANPMPNNPSMNQRIAWHLAHAKACGCRPIPDGVKAEIQKQAERSGGAPPRPSAT